MAKPDFKTEWESDHFDNAKDAMQTLLNSANAMGSGKAVVAGMFDGFIREHRTLQQAFVKNLVEMLRVWTEEDKVNVTDMRNESAFDWAQKVCEIDAIFPNI